MAGTSPAMTITSPNQVGRKVTPPQDSIAIKAALIRAARTHGFDVVGIARPEVAAAQQEAREQAKRLAAEEAACKVAAVEAKQALARELQVRGSAVGWVSPLP